jgi:hypothetical protein
MREVPQTGESFKYIGIPLVGKGYQTAHIEGTRALLSFLPLTMKGNALKGGPLRNAFLHSAAALLAVPERYTRTLTSLHQEIAQGVLPISRAHSYREARFGDATHLGINEVARFFASVGVTADEAEQWRPWATAYIDMELEEHPNGSSANTLQEARTLAHRRIDQDSQWVLKKIHADAPGNYNPELERMRAERPPREPRQPEAGPSSVATGDSITLRSTHPDAAEASDVQLGYGDGVDEDTRMGPA